MTNFSQLPFDFSLQNEFTFETLIVADRNSEVFHAFTDESGLQEQFYFIWGNQGSGKSHLLQALCQRKENAVYVSLLKYAEYGVTILDGLDNMDLVCLDDIQCCLNDSQWEENLFAFFNAMREKGKKLIVSASDAPRNLKPDLQDLASRLAWGVVYQVHELDDEGKAQALRLRAESRAIPLSKEVLNYILSRSSRSLSELFAVLDSLDHLSLAEKRKLTIPFVKNIMQW